MVLATVPAAPPTEKNQRATSWPPPISANVPYFVASRFSASAFCRVLEAVLSMIARLLFLQPTASRISDRVGPTPRRGAHRTGRRSLPEYHWDRRLPREGRVTGRCLQGGAALLQDAPQGPAREDQLPSSRAAGQ